MWGVGCVFGELFTGQPILSGKSDNHQCQLIFQLLGPPNKDWPGAMDLPNKTDLNIGLTCKRSLEQEFGPILQDDHALSLLDKLLTLNPYRRYNALDALKHSFFTTEPLPASPSQLRFEECHEIDKESFKKLGQPRKPYQPEPKHVSQSSTPAAEKRSFSRDNSPNILEPPPKKLAMAFLAIPQPPNKPPSSLPPPALRPGTGIFMPKKKKQQAPIKAQELSMPPKTLSPSSTPDRNTRMQAPTPTKLNRTPNSQTPKSERFDFESDLTDFEEDISTDKLKSLDLERYSISKNTKS
jgi:serine/threonine-protein kinase BUR1